MKKSLFATLSGTVLMMGALLLVLKTGARGMLWILLGLGLVLFVVSALTGIFYGGKKVQGRDRHP